jgi:hypothetical protein
MHLRQKTLFYIHHIKNTKNLLKNVLCFARPDNTQTATPDTHTNRGHTTTNPKKTNDEAGG